MKKIILFNLALITALGAVAQNIVRIPRDAATLSAAVQLAQSGDTILLSAGLYTDSVHITSKNLVFKGDSNGGSVLSPGINEKSFIVNKAEVEFIHLTFDDFQQNSPPPNYAISATNSNIKVDQCRFNSLHNAIYLLEGHLEISNSIFSTIRGSQASQHIGGTFLIYNNLIYEAAYFGMSINRAHGQFFNNTIVGTNSIRYFGLMIHSDSISHIYNNIIEGFGTGILLMATDSTEFKALRIYNNNINTALPYRYEYNENLSQPIYYGNLIPNPGTGEINSPSNYVDSANGNFNLKAGSPCIDAGINAYPFSVGLDLSRNNRIVGTNPDIGAYESSLFVGLEDKGFTKTNTGIEIFPQPTRNHVWVKYKKPFSGTLEVLDIAGNVLRRVEIKHTKKFKVNLPVLNGLFFLKMTSKEGIEVRRILKRI
jgi:hypothetical protein